MKVIAVSREQDGRCMVVLRGGFQDAVTASHATNVELVSIDGAGAVIPDVLSELASARAKYPAMRSAHEAESIIREEFEEFVQEVRKKAAERSWDDMRGELVQLAAMTLRALTDIAGDKVHR